MFLRMVRECFVGGNTMRAAIGIVEMSVRVHPLHDGAERVVDRPRQQRMRQWRVGVERWEESWVLVVTCT